MNTNTRRRTTASGFTLIELQVAMAIFVVMAGSSLMFTQSIVPALRADGQSRRLVALMHYARETAISSRRDIEVRFDAANSSAQLIKREAGLEVPMQTFVFEYGVTFSQYPGLGDTPEGFGANGVVDFGGSSVLLYDAEGSLIDETGMPANGTIFVGLGDSLQAARAITVTGTTGRARLYRWKPNGGTGGAWER